MIWMGWNLLLKGKALGVIVLLEQAGLTEIGFVLGEELGVLSKETLEAGAFVG